MKQTVQGYQLNNYNATFEEKTFFFEEQTYSDGARQIRVSDANGGFELVFMVETPKVKFLKRNRLATNNISRTKSQNDAPVLSEKGGETEGETWNTKNRKIRKKRPTKTGVAYVVSTCSNV